MLTRVTVLLARNPGFPAGSARHGYEIVAPLDAEGALCPEEWHEGRARCGVRRFWGDEPDREGCLVHRAGGPGGATWTIDYDEATTEDDEVAYRLDTHRLLPGEYVTIRDHAGVPHTFRVASAEIVDEEMDVTEGRAA